MKKTPKIVITFFTSSEAMACEKACKEANIDGKLISAPRELTSDCGISYKLEPIYKNSIEKLLKDKDIEYDKITEILLY